MKNTNVISPQDSKDHIINDYHFKAMSEFSPEKPATQSPESTDTQDIEATQQDFETQENESQVAILNASTQKVVEDLMKEKEGLIGKVARLEMQLEAKEREFAASLESAKKDAEQVGFERAKSECEREMSELRDKFSKSIAKLDEASAKLADFTAKNEAELADAAIDIAREVILKEVGENSAQIAVSLAKNLIAELKGAGAMELKVSPQDYEFVKGALKSNSRLKISLDDAISKGSVVILSDAGNLEANLNSRLEKIKQIVGE